MPQRKRTDSAMDRFDAAINRFIKENANGGAIRHLTDLGYSPEEIKGMLDFPMDLSEIEETVREYLKQKESPEGAYEIIREQTKYGKTTFRRIKKQDL